MEWLSPGTTHALQDAIAFVPESSLILGCLVEMTTCEKARRLADRPPSPLFDFEVLPRADEWTEDLRVDVLVDTGDRGSEDPFEVTATCDTREDPETRTSLCP